MWYRADREMAGSVERHSTNTSGLLYLSLDRINCQMAHTLNKKYLIIHLHGTRVGVLDTIRMID